ncbi:Protease Do-like 14-like protein [Heracleum sosnowskyi]|uniref:Protease Do-like 14-like protein n=1 Tax=Heracleum sosnowskyi TaxID=360622 RepID=A0AAD8M5H0_9APIA|nr:Protease Do-like 14-like protein [Heracleum sosnowskyi]
MEVRTSSVYVANGLIVLAKAPAMLKSFVPVFPQRFIATEETMFRRWEENGNPWERKAATFDLDASEMTYFREYFKSRPKFSERDNNATLDDISKEAALKANPSVVALECFIEGKETIRGCGIIIESNLNKCIVLTSANLIRRPTLDKDVKNVIPNDLKVYMYSFDNRSSCAEEVCAYDFHLNLAVLRFRTTTCFEPATLAHVKDPKNVTSRPFLRPHLRSSSTTPGDQVVAIGRYFTWPFELMAAPGCYLLRQTNYDCKELFTTSCVITRCGDGCPMVNARGEVIGVAYYDFNLTHCMPINIAWKWWQRCKQFGECRLPSLGIEGTYLLRARLGLLERIIVKFPHVSKGVLVEKVISGSCADLAGICDDDIIIQCAGKSVEGFLEFYETLMDHVGSFIELVVIRTNSVIPIQLKMEVVEVAPDQINSWPNR